jgi:hypothetical protein
VFAPHGHSCVPLRENTVYFLSTPWAPLPLTRKISARKAAPAVLLRRRPAQALAARLATAQAVPYVAVARAASPATASSPTPASVASPRGNSGIRDEARAASARNSELHRRTCRYEGCPRQDSQDRARRFQPLRKLVLFSMVSGRSGMVWQGTNGFGQGTVSAVPLSGQ